MRNKYPMSRAKNVFVGFLVVLLQTSCGQPNKDDETGNISIRNGNRASGVPVASLPTPVRYSTVGLMNRSGGHLCSATLIADNIVLTAAHCIQSAMRVYLGNEIRSASTVRVSEAVIHPNWQSRGRQVAPYDIAVVKLSQSIAGANRRPIKISFDPLVRNDQLMIAGYGNDGNYRYGSLRYTQVSLVSRDRYGRVNTAGSNNRGACDGDSGGPLFVLKNDSWRVAGALSGGVRCGGGNLYTEVASFKSFIDGAVERFVGTKADDEEPGADQPGNDESRPDSIPCDRPGHFRWKTLCLLR